MWFAAEIHTPELARLCRRLSTALEAGINLRLVWQREAEGRNAGAVRRRMLQISEAVNRGESVQAALAETGEFFPPLFRQMVAVGEETGQLPEILRRLADQYDAHLAMRRDFMRSIAGPALQLLAAASVVGLLIWILGIIAEATGTESADILGLGLIGTQGVLIYLTGWIVILVASYFGYRWLRHSIAHHERTHIILLALPVIGPALRTLALSRLAWSLNLTLDTGMSLRKAIPMSLASTDNAYYIRQSQPLLTDVLAGAPLSESMAKQGGYPVDFLDTLEVGEQSGRIPESMARLSQDYQERAQFALTTLAKVASFLVWALVALLVGAIIIRVFWVAYVQPIQQMMQ